MTAAQNSDSEGSVAEPAAHDDLPTHFGGEPAGVLQPPRARSPHAVADHPLSPELAPHYVRDIISRLQTSGERSTVTQDTKGTISVLLYAAASDSSGSAARPQPSALNVYRCNSCSLAFRQSASQCRMLPREVWAHSIGAPFVMLLHRLVCLIC